MNSYVQRFLSQPDVELRSANLTPESLSVSVRRTVQPMTCVGMLGIDRNLNNITTSQHREPNRTVRPQPSKQQSSRSVDRGKGGSQETTSRSGRDYCQQVRAIGEKPRSLVTTQRVRKHHPPSQTEEPSHSHGGVEEASGNYTGKATAREEDYRSKDELLVLR